MILSVIYLLFNMSETASKNFKPSWKPKVFKRYVRGLDTSMQTVEIVTDAGKGYMKAMGNPEGSHPLAGELVGTRLANWLGLRTFDFCIFYIHDGVDIPFQNGGKALSGPAFLSRADEGGIVWSGTEDILKLLENPHDLTKLIVFDTSWWRNP